MKNLPFLYGAAYYSEYMPYDRVDTDFRLMKEAGMNVVRIAESTWSTWEPEDGVFDFTHLHKMLDAAEKYEMSVIIGTPTYAIPSWLAKKYPDIMSSSIWGDAKYGRRQQFDLRNKDYLRYAERIIRKLLEECASNPRVIGFQIDNECRSAWAANPDMQSEFVSRLKKKYPDIDDFNRDFGLDYWSNRLSDWEDFPDVRGTINGSISAAYKEFLRNTVTEFLHWQASIVDEYRRDDQFITHNFDFSWIDYSHGLQPEMNQKDCAKCMDIAGTDIYHLSQDRLDGAMIAFGGAIGRSLKKAPYLVLETQAQGRTAWLPYPGQLRLQAYAHIASGARSVMYWNWHSIHNAIESYWKGVLSHDLLPGDIYEEASAFRHEMTPVEMDLILSKKKSSVAILADNRSLAGIQEFPFIEGDDQDEYNDVLRTIFDTLYKMNIETDIVYADDDFSSYKVLVIPMLYSASEETISSLRAYVEGGGHLLLTFRSLFSDENIKIYHDAQPHGFTDVVGMTYDRFTNPRESDGITFTDSWERQTDISYPISGWMEMLRPATADIWARYTENAWEKYAAITHKRYGSGTTTYLGAHLNEAGYRELFRRIFDIAGIEISETQFPIIIRRGINAAGEEVIFYMNFSSEESCARYEGAPATVVLANGTLASGDPVSDGDSFTLAPWDLVIFKTIN